MSREPITVDVNWPASFSLDRPPVRFILNDCFKMGVAVGAGLCCGVIAVIGTLLLVHSAIHWMFA